MEFLPLPVTMMMCSMPLTTHSSTTYWICGLSTTVSISLGCAFVAGKKRVPRPAAGRTALRTLRPTALFPCVVSAIPAPRDSFLRWDFLFLGILGSCFFRVAAFFLTGGLGRTRRCLFRIAATGFFRVVGHVPSRAFELDGRSGDEPLHFAATVRAFLQMPPVNTLDFFRSPATLL